MRWACALLWVVFASGAVAQGGYRVGDRVEVDIIMSGAPERAMYRAGTIEKFEDGDVHVRLDNGELRKIPLRSDKHWVRPAQGGAARPPGDAPEQRTGTAPDRPSRRPAARGVQPGDRVEVDIIMSGAPDRAMYRTGTVERVEGGEIHVRLDNGEMRSLPDRPDKHWVRPSDDPPPQAPRAPREPRAPRAPAEPAPAPRAPVPPADGPVVRVPRPPAAPAPAPPAAPPAPAAPAPGGPRGETPHGAPPDGVYVCQKIGQTYMGLGDLDIRGGRYRGIGPDRGFHPFTVGAGGEIAWSDGIAGLPDGWTIRRSLYAGLDEGGRPIIKIDYTSRSGWNDRIDCVRE